MEARKPDRERERESVACTGILIGVATHAERGKEVEIVPGNSLG